MSVVIVCPSCQSKSKIKSESDLGRTVKCPGCEEMFVAAKPRSDKEAGSSSVASKRIDSRKSKKPSSIQSQPKAAAKATASNDDEWLDALDEVAVPSNRRHAHPAPPPVLGVKKRPQRAEGSGEARESIERPIWVHWMLMLVSGAVGGLIGTAIWAGFIAWTGWTSGYIAIVVGTLVGVGVRIGASKWDYGWGPAIAASLIALGALALGKVIGMKILFADYDRELRDWQSQHLAAMQHENYQIHRIALELHEGAAEGTYDWTTVARNEDEDDDFDADSATDPEQLPKHYPAKLWDDASEKWKRMPEEDKAKRRKDVETEVAQARTEEAQEAGFLSDAPQAFHPFDIIWLIFGVSAAFRLATGMTDD